MKPKFPKILSWLAGKTGTSDHAAHRLWRNALRDATVECTVIESPAYWQLAVEHLLSSFASLSPTAEPLSVPTTATALAERPHLPMADQAATTKSQACTSNTRRLS